MLDLPVIWQFMRKNRIKYIQKIQQKNIRDSQSRSFFVGYLKFIYFNRTSDMVCMYMLSILISNAFVVQWQKIQKKQ